MRLKYRQFSKAPKSQINQAVDEDADIPEDPGPQDDSVPFAGNVTHNGIHIKVDGREALDFSLYEFPRAEDNCHRKYQRIHDVDQTHRILEDPRVVALPLYDAKLATRWKPPPSREGIFTIDYLVPVRGIVALISFSHFREFACLSSPQISAYRRILTLRLERTAVSFRLFNVAQRSMYKFKAFAGDVNVAAPKSKGVRTLASPYDKSDQDYFVAPTQKWVHGIRFADDPLVVRQFQVLQGNSKYVFDVANFNLSFLLTMKERYSLASLFSKDCSVKCIEIQITSCK